MGWRRGCGKVARWFLADPCPPPARTKPKPNWGPRGAQCAPGVLLSNFGPGLPGKVAVNVRFRWRNAKKPSRWAHRPSRRTPPPTRDGSDRLSDAGPPPGEPDETS